METRRKRLVIRSIIVSLVYFCFVVQSLLAHVRMEVSVNPKVPRLYEDFQIIVSVNEENDFKHRVYFEKENFSNRLILLGGPYVRSSEEKITEYIYSVRANEIGEVSLPQFFYENGKTFISVKSFSFEVLPQKSQLKNYQLTGGYRNPPLNVYQGQAFDLVLEAQNLTKLMPVSVNNIPEISNAIIKNAPGFGDIFKRKVEDIMLYNVPVMAWIFSSNHVGTLTLPSISMNTGEHTMTSSPVMIKVLPLPMEVKKSKAVGDFSLSSEISESEIEEDSSILVKVRLDGEGNFHILRFPDLIVEEKYFTIQKEDELRMLVPSKRGYSGYIERTYRIRPKQSIQTTSIIIPEFVFWDPSLLLIQKNTAKIYPISIKKRVNHSDVFSFFSSEKILLKKDFSVISIVSLWFLLVPLLLWKFIMIWREKKDHNSISFFSILAFPFFLFLTPKEIPKVLRTAEEYIEQENWKVVQKTFADAVKILPRHKAVLTYNQAVAMQKMNEIGWAGYYLMCAIQYDPFEPIYRKAWNLYQKRLKISSSVVHYGVIYAVYLYICLFIIAFIILFIGVVEKNNVYKKRIYFSLVALVATIFVIMLVYQTHSKKSWAIALKDLNLRQIPETDSTTLYMIKQGTLLEVIANFDNFYLLRNHSEKIEGWTTTDGFAFNLEDRYVKKL